jgi:hypothetical protein
LFVCSRKASSSCPDLALGFAFEPALDDPRRHNGVICDLVVVTALFGAVDSLQVYDDTSVTFEWSCMFAFMNRDAAEAIGVKQGVTSGALPMHSYWNIVVLEDEDMPFGSDPSENGRNSRAPKMLGHRAFRFARTMLYVDSKLKIMQYEKLLLFAEVFLIQAHAAWISPKHPKRLSAYSEAKCAHKLELVGDIALEQMSVYESNGFPPEPEHSGGPGLIEGEWHLRDLNRPESEMIGCEWFREFQHWGHRRDQLSFNYVVWSLFHNDTTVDALYRMQNPAFSYARYQPHKLLKHVAHAKWYQEKQKRNVSSEVCVAEATEENYF